MIKEVNDYIKAIYDENKLAHAFLIETNNLDSALLDIKELIKYFFCKEKNSNISNLIDKDLLPSLKIIKPDGIQIKKEQTMNLIKEFSSTPIYTEKNIYIIYYAEKLNDSSANCLLKFIEEPEADIIGFFIVKNADNVISTIKSRCVRLKYYYGFTEYYKLLEITEDDYKDFNDVSETLLENIVNSKDLLLENKNIFKDYYSDKSKIENIFKITMQKLENEILNRNSIAIKYDVLSEYLKSYSDNKIIEIIKILIAFLDDINYNVNMELFLDKFAIEVSEVYE